MKTKLMLRALAFSALLLSTLNPQLTTALAQGSAFTYQGRLDDDGGPANGNYDLRFAIYDVTSGSVPIAGPMTNSGTGVRGGLFTVTLDYGAGVFTGAERWLEIGVRTNGGGAFTTLVPRQPILPTPYAMFSGGVNAGGIAGAIPSTALGGTYDNALNFSNAGNSFSGNGTGLTNVNAVTLGGLTSSNLWRTSGNFGTIAGQNFLGTTDNQPLEFKANNRRLLRLEPNTNHAPNIVAGDPLNSMSGAIGSTIAGGGGRNRFDFMLANTVAADFGTIGGGGNNQIAPGGHYSTIGGGFQNTNGLNAEYTTIAGGFLGGIGNDSDWATVGGGSLNLISAGSPYATIAAGRSNEIGTNAAASTIAGGRENRIAANSGNGNIAGGYLNELGVSTYGSAVGGGSGNKIGADAYFAVIAGGQINDIGMDSDFGFIGGGFDNNIANQSKYATIAGGQLNDIGVDADFSAIGGGLNNNIAAGSGYAIIAGGRLNDIGLSSSNSTVGGGYDNNIAVSAPYATISGGSVNSIGNSSSYSVVGGGQNNHIAGDSFSAHIAGGGSGNIRANSDYSALGGGFDNSTTVNAQYATIPGGRANSVTNYAFAAGRRAKANHQGAFVWADSQDEDFASFRANHFRVRADGGARFDFNEGHWVDLRYGLSLTTGFYIINTSSGATLTPGGTWSNSSDRERKTGFMTVDPQAVLAKLAALPLNEWSYKAEGETIRHLGPVAQDFHAAFGLGGNDKAIATVDADGVALAAIQGLNQKVEAESQRSEVRSQRLEAENKELKARLSALEKLVANLNSKGN